MKSVYIVSSGEKYEGGSIEGVYLTKEDADIAAMKVECCFDGGWTFKEDGYWENGCDWLMVERWDIK